MFHCKERTMEIYQESFQQQFRRVEEQSSFSATNEPFFWGDLRHFVSTEYTNSRFIELCKEHGIKRHFTVWKARQQNSVVERMNRSIVERARCIRLNAGL